ncbi:hypothetical protein GCM10017608_00410 [Agromyces luteolus]|uniref:DUF3558 domain-containing protein n=1 Tax=Agromyces luteolus TaxID=88373 RepID=A0A7C9HNV6_9MICO|nr:hypothetical protein [Agromyces luteolus]MUN05569.1 hypothetical protein [Agromyces luteolus]GLK26109.1 hypothetical protein GCM10017608_00410 [Agromyces luteolus]
MSTRTGAASADPARPGIAARLRAPGILAVALAAGVSLSACAAPSAGPAGPTTAAATPTPSTEPVAETAPGSEPPVARYDLDCDGLVPATLVGDLFAAPVEPTDPLVTASSVGISLPRMTSIVAVGGLACEWSNGEPSNSQYGTNPAHVGLLVTVVPPPAGGWSDTAVRFGMPAAGTDCGGQTCTATQPASGAWVQVQATDGSGAPDPTTFGRVVDAAVAAVDAASPPEPPAATGSAIPDDCQDLVPDAVVESAAGVAEVVESSFAGGWSEWAEAKTIAGDLGCRWFRADADEIVAGADWVRGGRWAYERIADGGGLVPPGSEVDLGLVAPDVAVLRCDAAYGTCAVDVVVGADWVQVTAPDESVAVAVATEVAGRLAT